VIQSQQIQSSRRGSGGAAAATKLTRRYSDVVLTKTCHLTALISLASSSLTHSRRTSASTEPDGESTDYSWFHGSRSLSGMTHAPFPLYSRFMTTRIAIALPARLVDYTPVDRHWKLCSQLELGVNHVHQNSSPTTLIFDVRTQNHITGCPLFFNIDFP